MFIHSDTVCEVLLRLVALVLSNTQHKHFFATKKAGAGMLCVASGAPCLSQCIRSASELARPNLPHSAWQFWNGDRDETREFAADVWRVLTT